MLNLPPSIQRKTSLTSLITITGKSQLPFGESGEHLMFLPELSALLSFDSVFGGVFTMPSLPTKKNRSFYLALSAGDPRVCTYFG